MKSLRQESVVVCLTTALQQPLALMDGSCKKRSAYEDFTYEGTTYLC